MKMKKTMLSVALLAAAMTANAQGGNTGMGGCDGNYKSLAEKVARLEKKTDAFNLYFNYAATGWKRTAWPTTPRRASPTSSCASR